MERMPNNPHLFEGDTEIPADWAMSEIMYEVPGYGVPSVEKYLYAREKNKSELERITLSSRFESADNESERINLIRNALLSSDPLLQESGASLAQYINDIGRCDEVNGLIDANARNALNSIDPERKKLGMAMVRYASENVRIDLSSLTHSFIDECLESDSQSIRRIGAQSINLIAVKSDKVDHVNKLQQIIRSQLLNPSFAHEESVDLIRYLPSSLIPNLLEEIFEMNDIEVKRMAAQYIKRLEPTSAIRIIQLVFETDDIQLKRIAAEASRRLFMQNDKQPLVPKRISDAIYKETREALDSIDQDVRKIGSEMICDVPDNDELFSLIQKGMGSGDMVVKVNAIKAVRYLRTRTDADKNAMSEIIFSAMESSDLRVQYAAIAAARYIPEPQKSRVMGMAFNLVSRLVNSTNRNDQRHGAKMFYYVSHEKSEEIMKTIERDQELLKILLFSRLYPENQEIQQNQDVTHFHRRIPFVKTGSEMTILREGTLEQKILIRHIKNSAFIGWVRAFEAYESWLNAGFDYVPVEPIQSFSLGANEASVYAGVLDIDLKHWLNVSGGRFKDELLENREQIMMVLKNLGIRHSDLHTGNFFLRFERKSNDSIDVSVCPRIYVGDFDKSQVKTNLGK